MYLTAYRVLSKKTGATAIHTALYRHGQAALPTNRTEIILFLQSPGTWAKLHRYSRPLLDKLQERNLPIISYLDIVAPDDLTPAALRKACTRFAEHLTYDQLPLLAEVSGLWLQLSISQANNIILGMEFPVLVEATAAFLESTSAQPSATTPS